MNLASKVESDERGAQGARGVGGPEQQDVDGRWRRWVTATAVGRSWRHNAYDLGEFVHVILATLCTRQALRCCAAGTVAGSFHGLCMLLVARAFPPRGTHS